MLYPFGGHSPVNRAPVVNKVQAPERVAVVPVNVSAKRAFKFIFTCFFFHVQPPLILLLQHFARGRKTTARQPRQFRTRNK